MDNLIALHYEPIASGVGIVAFMARIRIRIQNARYALNFTTLSIAVTPSRMAISMMPTGNSF